MWVRGSLDHGLFKTGKFRKKSSTEHGKAENLCVCKKIDKTPGKSTEQNKPQKIYAYMECINVESS